MSVNNLNASLVREIMDRLRKLETTAPVGYTAVTEGSLRIASDEGLIVEGSAKVTGVLKGLGRFLWDGIVTLTSTFTAQGTTRLEGDTTQVGAHHVQGNQDITGTLAVKGVATLENNLQVKTGGKITVEGTPTLELSETGGAATLKFGNGPRVWSDGAAARMDSGPGTGIVVATSIAAILRSPNTANAVATSDSGTTITGDLISNLPTITAAGKTPNVWCDPATKKFYRLI